MLVNPTINLKVLWCLQFFADFLKASEADEFDTSTYNERYIPKINQNWLKDTLKPNTRLDFECCAIHATEEREEETTKKTQQSMELFS